MSEKEQRPDPDRNPPFRSSKLLERIEALLSKVWFTNHERQPELSQETSVVDPYVAAGIEFDRRLEELQEAREMRRASEIESEYEQEEHFDQLTRLYRQVCWEMGLAWPPPSGKLDSEEFPIDADCEWWD